MRTIKQLLGIDKEVSPDFPDGAIVNQTDTRDGTPVVREIYNDILSSNYQLLAEVDILPNGEEDSITNGHQILDALKLLPNETNDIEQILSLTGTVWSISLKLEILPNKYVFVARPTEDYVSGTTYSFKGSESTEYGFTSSGFKAGELLLVVIDQSGVRAYSISSISSSVSEVFTVLGSAVAFNDSSKMWYQESGYLMSDVPSSDNLEAIIRVDVSNGTVLLTDMFVMNGYVLCFCNIPSTNTYFFRQFSLSDLSGSTAVVISGTTFSASSDYAPYVYAEAGVVYVTNGMNSTANAYTIAKLNYSPGTLTFVSTQNINNAFVKTTNAVVKSGVMYTMISGVLESFSLSGTTKTSLGTFSGVAGQIFSFNGQIYFSSGEVAKKWF